MNLRSFGHLRRNVYPAGIEDMYRAEHVLCRIPDPSSPQRTPMSRGYLHRGQPLPETEMALNSDSRTWSLRLGTMA